MNAINIPANSVCKHTELFQMFSMLYFFFILSSQGSNVITLGWILVGAVGLLHPLIESEEIVRVESQYLGWR